MTIPLIASKLTQPRLRAGIIERPRVRAALEQAAQAGVVLVSAPAGYGKTVAVSSWLPQAPWVSLDAGDNDPVRLWTYVAAAVGAPLRAGPLEAAIEPLLGGTLVLEDVHVIVDEACLATLAHAVAGPPRGRATGARHARRSADPAGAAARPGRARRGPRGHAGLHVATKPRGCSAGTLPR